ncbi:cobalt-precorrin-5B (C1)-methyltransferase [Prevotella sp. tc2-28]|uniref:cobalt-precorrin-5B (C(1))-methyltransferase CbiD n=1 Tax=Prevotella sp. tc2-28 TaxID=1761888 RepID=UPI0008983B31|nr:cobalt-precorrin-5B (C(1))-methyltransferase CbiD [Prevotella sp. tc2-28]SEA26220.1 cobalt-precorrin-5B (C1)-methyltransferase [Prevotella sp. tc2-28]
MILVFGGTTEGRQAAQVLEEAGNVYYYSTKRGEQQLTLHHGMHVDGAMDEETMTAFVNEHGIRLIVDAAHPFASQLHQTIASVASKLTIPVIRYERIYPPRDPDITWIDEYGQVPTDIHTLLATTGVQSISRLKWLEAKGVKVIYRILNRESSILLAHQQGISDEQLCYYPETPEADAMLMKESGLSGGFAEKVEEARQHGMKIIVIKRPLLHFKHCVNGPHGLRRDVERLLPEFFPLHSGLTTGTCATAAAIAATTRLTTGEMPSEVHVVLPDGETISVAVGYADDYAYCIKEAGDDPDVTDGIEVRAKVEKASQFEICGGVGVGRFTLPGFDYPVGEPAINKAPRQMMRENITEDVRVTISVPQGETIARKTFNPRLGIRGGISIIGVSGVVKPFSEEAFIESIRKCMEVAKASGTDRVVINSGAKSERFVKAMYAKLPQQAFVQYGNYIGETLTMANHLGIKHVTLGVMLGKAVKLAAGHLDTHSRKTVMDMAFVQQMLNESGISINISDMTQARELWERIAEEGKTVFARTVIRHCYEHCAPLLPNGELLILLIDDKGKIYEG